MGKYDSATTEVLHRITLDGTCETVGDVSTWGEIHFGLGRLSRDELTAHHSDLLAEAGVAAVDFPDGAFWIVDEDRYGFVGASGYDDEKSYRAAMDALERRWLTFDDAAG